MPGCCLIGPFLRFGFISDGCFPVSIVACEYRAKVWLINWLSEKFWFDVARMSHAHTSRVLDEYQAAVDEIVASCNGDLRGAVRALILANEQLEQRLQRMSAELVERLSDDPPETVY
jgi:hypothetical protein